MNQLKRTITTAAVFLLSAGGLAAQGESGDLYLSKCATCHGPNGAAQTAKGKKLKMKSVKETVGKVSVDEMIKIVDAGKGPDMDAYGKQLSKDQIKGLVDYYRGLAK